MNLTHDNAFNTKCRISNRITLLKNATQISIQFHLSLYSKKPSKRIKINDTYRSQHSKVLSKQGSFDSITCEVREAIKGWVFTHFQNALNVPPPPQNKHTTTRTQSPSYPWLRFVQLTEHCCATVTNPVLSSKLLVFRYQPVNRLP